MSVRQGLSKSKSWLVTLSLLGLALLLSFSWAQGQLQQHSVLSSRSGNPTHLLLLGLDSRPGADNGVPDSLVVIDLQTGESQNIPRNWSSSNRSGKTLAHEYLGIENCEPYCSIQGVYMLSQLPSETRVALTKPEAMNKTREVIEAEYGLPSLAIVVYDLTWAWSFFHKLEPITLTIASPIPVGGANLGEAYGKVEYWLPTGTRALSGEEMFWFGRARFQSSNNERMLRQASLLKEILSQRSKSEIAFAAFQSKGLLLTDLQLLEFLKLGLLPAPVSG
jgi:hypothetical protein